MIKGDLIYVLAPFRFRYNLIKIQLIKNNNEK